MDIRDLKFDADAFDVAIDKGTRIVLHWSTEVNHAVVITSRR